MNAERRAGIRMRREHASRVQAALEDERATIGGIFRLVSALALAWGVSPRFVLFLLSMDAPDEGELPGWSRAPGIAFLPRSKRR